MFFSAKDMIKSNLYAFFTAKLESMNSEDALHFMILTRYNLFPKKREEFIMLYALFLSFLENPETSDMDFPMAFGTLNIVLDSFYLHHEIPEDITKKEKEELEMLRSVISLMLIYESGAIFKSPESFGFPTIKFLDDFLYNIDKEYYERLRSKQRYNKKKVSIQNSTIVKNMKLGRLGRFKKMKRKDAIFDNHCSNTFSY